MAYYVALPARVSKLSALIQVNYAKVDIIWFNNITLRLESPISS